ncbi:T9SS type A sorting domain-containing protein [Aquimarina pacifica]
MVTNENEVNMSHMSSGVYLLILKSTTGKVAFKKLLKE